MYENLKIMYEINEKNLPCLDIAVLGALELFMKKGLPEIKIREFKKPVIVGSGNAIATAKILYDGSDVVFADENNYKEAMEINGVDGVLIFSASGGKHAPIIAKEAISNKLDCQVITCTKNSPTEKIVGSENTIVTEKNREPYTYNTSTYMGWLLAKTREDPKKIYDFILEIVDKKIPKNISDYNGYLFITPNKFSKVNPLFEVKFTELFGRRIARDIKTFEEVKHAITVVPYEKELCIRFGKKEDIIFENDILDIPLYDDIGPAGMMAIGYYIVGKIACGKPHWFQGNIFKYVEKLNKNSFGKGLSVIVE